MSDIGKKLDQAYWCGIEKCLELVKNIMGGKNMYEDPKNWETWRKIMQRVPELHKD